MKPVNKIFIFPVILIVILTIIFQLRNTRQTSQTKSILISGNIDESQIIQKTQESEDPKQHSSQKNDISQDLSKTDIHTIPLNEHIVKKSNASEKNIDTSRVDTETPTDSHNDTILKKSNISETIIETYPMSEKRQPDISNDNNDRSSQNPDEDNEEKSSVMIFLGDNDYMIHPGWVKKEGRSEKYNQYSIDDETVCFTVEEPLKSMKWSKYFEQEIDPEVYSHLVFEYTAESLKAIEDEYTLWVFDLRGGYGGFTIIPSSQIIPDGYKHTINVDLSSFDIKEFIHQIAIQVYSGEEGNGSLTIHKLEFLPKEENP